MLKVVMRLSSVPWLVLLFACWPWGGQWAVAQNQSQPPRQSPAPLRAAAPKKGLVAHLERIIPQMMEEGDVPGLSIVLIRDARVVWHKGFGVKNAETKEPVRDNTVFEAASLSKPVFAYAVLKL